MAKVENEWDRDKDLQDLQNLLFVTYDPNRISVEKLLETVREFEEHKLEAEVKSEE